jgi:hypothetical protein
MSPHHDAGRLVRQACISLTLAPMTQNGNGQLPPVTPYLTLKEAIAGASRPSNFPGSKRVSSPEEGVQVPRPLVAETETSMVRCLGILGTGGSGVALRERGQNLYFGMVRWNACQASSVVRAQMIRVASRVMGYAVWLPGDHRLSRQGTGETSQHGHGHREGESTVSSAILSRLIERRRNP